MEDNRTPLAEGTALELNRTKLRIIGEAGRDPDSITYIAEYDGFSQRVMIKECFPACDGISRADDGSIDISDEACPVFNNALLRLKKETERNRTIRNTLGLVNSTREVELYNVGKTAYAVMSCIDGCDYSRSVDNDAMSVLVRILAVAKVLKKYHDNGYLHLNLRPENIFVIPETKEHIVLSGLGTVHSFYELKSCTKEQLSVSAEYSAPEIVNGFINEIDARTDIYSVGAIAWTKLVGSYPQAIRRNDELFLPDSPMLCDERFQPVFFRELEHFFRHTLAVSVGDRFINDDEMIQCLEKLVKLSDTERIRLIGNFSYDFSGFVGREPELKKIDEILKARSAVFLYGVGGIGKTELARRFAKLNEAKFRHILFCYYEGSVRDTVYSIDIPGAEKEPNETDDDYFRRKLRLLKSLVSDNDLIILDNYDTYDDELKLLLECNCSFIITTRIDQPQFGCEQMYVDCFSDINDAITLFRNSCQTEYVPSEQEALCDLIEFLERHTMTIALAAKYMAYSKEMPSGFLSRLRRKEGITAPTDVDVRQRKDHKMRKARIDQHLVSLFDISSFTEPEQELIGSLSLLGNIRIKKAAFLNKFCCFSGNEAALERLVHSGWIKYDSSSEKISLHQVILDLVYNVLRPTAENCQHITATMAELAVDSIENNFDSKKRNQVVGEFIARVTGNSPGYARLLLNYCYNLVNIQYVHNGLEQEYISKSEQCCGDTPAGRLVLKDIYIFKVEQIEPDDSMINFENENAFAETINRILELCRKAIAIARELDSPAEYAEDLVDVAWLVDKKTQCFAAMIYNDISDIALAYADGLLHEAANIVISDGGISPDVKITLLRRIRYFYTENGDDGFIGTNFRRDELYANEELAAHYLELIEYYKSILPDSERSDLKNGIIIAETEDEVYAPSGDDWVNGNNMLELGEYQSAIGSYLADIEKEGETLDNTIGLCNAYHFTDEPPKALIYAQKAVMLSQKSENQILLARSHHECGRNDDAAEICLAVLEQECERISQEKLDAEYLLYCMERDIEQKTTRWEKCVSLYNELDHNNESPEFDDVFGSFIIELSLNDHSRENTLYHLYRYLERKKVCTGVIFDYILDNCECCGFPEYRVLAYLLRAGKSCLNEDIQQKNCDIAMGLFHKLDITAADRYLLNKIYFGFSKYLPYGETHKYKEKCDYYLIAEKECEGMAPKEAAELWEDICSQAIQTDFEEKCCRKYFEVIESSGIITSSYPGKVEDYATLLMDKGEFREAAEAVAHAMHIIANYYLNGGYDADTYYTPDDYYGTIREKCDLIAEAFDQTIWFLSSYKEAPEFYRYYIALKLAACVIKLGGQYDDDLITMFLSSYHDGIEKLGKRLEKAMQSEYEVSHVNDIFNIYENLPSQFRSEMEFRHIDELFQQYFSRSSSDDIDFKTREALNKSGAQIAQSVQRNISHFSYGSSDVLR